MRLCRLGSCMPSCWGQNSELHLAVPLLFWRRMHCCGTDLPCAADHSAVRNVQVYPRLSERLGVKDHVMVLNIMLQKIAVNLKAFASCEDVVSHTLNLFQASGFTTSWLLGCGANPLSSCSCARVPSHCSITMAATVTLESLLECGYHGFKLMLRCWPLEGCPLLPPAHPVLRLLTHLDLDTTAGPGQRLHERQAAAEAGGGELPAAAPPRRALCVSGRAWQHAAPVSLSMHAQSCKAVKRDVWQ